MRTKSSFAAVAMLWFFGCGSSENGSPEDMANATRIIRERPDAWPGLNLSEGGLQPENNFIPHYAAFYGGDTGVIYYKHETQTSWSSWYDLSAHAPLTFPGSANWGWDRLDVFTAGPTTSSTQQMYHTYQTTAGGTVSMDSWGIPSGYTFYSKPDATSWGDQRLDVFVLGKQTSSGHVYLMHKAWDHGTVYDWESFGAPSGGFDLGNHDLTAISWGSSRNDIWVLTNSGGTTKLWHAWTTTGAPQGNWDDWTSLMGTHPFVTTQAVGIDSGSWGNQRLDVFGIDSSGVTQHVYWDHGSSGQDSWGNPSSTQLGRVTLSWTCAAGCAQYYVMVQDQNTSGPRLWEELWFGTAKGWNNTTPGEPDGYSGGYDMTGPYLTP